MPLGSGRLVVYPVYEWLGFLDMGCLQCHGSISRLLFHGWHFTCGSEGVFARQVVALFGGHVLRVPCDFLWVYNVGRQWLYGVVPLTDPDCGKWQHYKSRPFVESQECVFWLAAFCSNVFYFLVNCNLETGGYPEKSMTK